jgi:hypothetical protein
MNPAPRVSRQPSRPVWTRERLLHERAVAWGMALDRSSLLSYSSALQSYLTFCSSHAFPPEPTPDTLSLYVVYISHFLKPNSVKTYLSGICSQLESFYPDVRHHRSHHFVVRALRGCAKRFSTGTTRKRPLTRSDLTAVHNAYAHSTSHDDLLFVAILFSGFHALMRLGELVWPDNPSLRNYRKISMRTSVSTLPDDAVSFFLPTHKADPLFEGNRIVLRHLEAPHSPARAFRAYLASRDNLFPLHPPLWLRSDGSIPTRAWFLRRLRRHFPVDIAGQSMRCGGATALAQDGVSLDHIQAIGRWASSTFHIYIRQHPVLLAAQLSPHPGR